MIAIMLPSLSCPSTWKSFRKEPARGASQGKSSPLSDPAKVPMLAVKWEFPATGATALGGGFRASPVVANGRVFIGNGNGRLYALDANTGALLWQYPAAGSPGLTSTYTCNPSSLGIASSAVITSVGGTEAVIFAAPDRSIGTGLGEGRLFALNASTGAEIWKSPVIARLTGTSSGSTTQYHEQIGYSSPLVFNDHVYVGIGDHCDSPIQKGRVAAVLLASGAIDAAFSYCSTGTCADSTRGGGVWSPIAGWANAVFVTTGNTRRWGEPEPSPNNGLSLLRLNPSNGTIVWKYQPVPWDRDEDPDWSAPPTVMSTSCGMRVVSTQKDGWTHALEPVMGSRQWSYPPPPAGIPFTPTDGTVHGDSRYMRGGAAWGDVYIAMNGGRNLIATGVSGGYRRLHAFNVCAAASDRVRWIVDVPGATGGAYSLGHPTVTGGIVYVGTNSGQLIAIADPSKYPPAGWRCVNPDVATSNCVASGYTLVPDPAVLANVMLNGSMVYNEPALADGKLFVATGAGKVYMLSP